MSKLQGSILTVLVLFDLGLQFFGPANSLSFLRSGGSELISMAGALPALILQVLAGVAWIIGAGIAVAAGIVAAGAIYVWWQQRELGRSHHA